tara:strand:- start:418 stop:690 length:273 start_codon:yes stop_codon:yes gene_type:complete
MKQAKVQIEYDEDQKQTRKRVKNKKTGREEMKQVTVKDPKCWRIVTSRNHKIWMPGMWLTKRQLDLIISSKHVDVEIGLPGQFRVNSRGY